MATPRGTFAPELLPEGWFDEALRPEGWFSQDFLEPVGGGADATATGAVLTATTSLIAGIATGGSGAVDATATGATISFTLTALSGAATASSQAAGATLSQSVTVIPGVASAASTAPGATVTATETLIAGQAQASSTAAGQSLTVGYSITPGTASGASGATATGATVAVVYSVIPGQATGEVISFPASRGGIPLRSIKRKFWEDRADEWLQERLEAVKEAIGEPQGARRKVSRSVVAESAEKLQAWPEFAPQINALEAIAARLARPSVDYSALAAAVALQMPAIEKKHRDLRRRRDAEALLLLVA